jgi:glycosyltransferase involved in cell wall biosynthesis
VSAAEARTPLPALPARPRVSVLGLAYNHERFIAESVESVLAQEWPAEQLQYVVVNDGSTDGTARALDPYRDRVTVIDQENQGMVGAVHTAMAALDGDVIVVCEGDDAMKPGRIAKVVQAFRDNPAAGVVYSDCELIDAHGTVLAPSFLDFARLDRVNGRARGRLLRGNVVPGVCCAIRGAFKPLVDPTPEHAAWPDFWWVWTINGVADIVHLPEPLARYRLHHDNSTLGVDGERQRRNILRELPFRRHMLAEIGAGEATAEELLRGVVELWAGAENAGAGVEQALPPRPDAGDALPLIAEAFARVDADDLDGAALACARATALRPFDPALRSLAAELAARVERKPRLARERSTLRALDTRGFVTVALARDIVAAPALLRSYAARFGADDDATLLICAEPDESAASEQAVSELVASAGLDGPDAADMVLSVAPKARVRACAAEADAMLLRERPYGPTAAYGVDDLDSLRIVAERAWSTRSFSEAAG